MATELIAMQEADLKNESLAWPDKARALEVSDQQTYNEATSSLIGIKSLIKRIDDFCDPGIKRWHEGHRSAVAQKKTLTDPLIEAEAIFKRAIGKYETEQRRIQDELERKAREEARKQEEEMRLALAVEAEELGADAATTEEILSTPIPTVAPVIAPTFQRQQGISTSQRWHAEVTDIKALCRAVADGKASSEFVQANLVALNAMARAMKSTMNVPGVKAVKETSVAARAR